MPAEEPFSPHERRLLQYWCDDCQALIDTFNANYIKAFDRLRGINAAIGGKVPMVSLDDVRKELDYKK